MCSFRLGSNLLLLAVFELSSVLHHKLSVILILLFADCFLLSGEEEFTTKLRFTFETEKKVMLLNFDPSRPEGVVAFQPSQL